MNASTPAICLREVDCQIARSFALQNLNFSIRPGEFIGIVGANGSGKSSLLKLLLGFHTNDTGEIKVNGTNLQELTTAQRSQNLAYHEQAVVDFCHIKLIDLIRLGISGNTRPKVDKRIQAYLDEFELQSKQDCSIQELSGGEIQRGLFIQTLIQNASILLLDEISNHLDIHFQIKILQFLKDCNRTKILAIHDFNHALRYCDRLLLLERGAQLAFDTPAAVLRSTEFAAALRRPIRFVGTAADQLVSFYE